MKGDMDLEQGIACPRDFASPPKERSGTGGHRFCQAMQASIDAAVASGRLDVDAQAAPIRGALALASEMDRARHVDGAQLKLLLDFSKALRLLPGARR